MTAQWRTTVWALVFTFFLACTGAWQAILVGVAAVNIVWFGTGWWAARDD